MVIDSLADSLGVGYSSSDLIDLTHGDRECRATLVNNPNQVLVRHLYEPLLPPPSPTHLPKIRAPIHTPSPGYIRKWPVDSLWFHD